MAMQNGLSAAIMNPNSEEMQKAYACFCMLSGRDPQCRKYISFAEAYAAQHAASVPAAGACAAQPAGAAHEDSADGMTPLRRAIIKGLKADAASFTMELVKTTVPLDIINNELIPALDVVGKGFEEKRMYLPQLLMSAEAAKAAFDKLRAALAASGQEAQSRGKILLATVEGDIHDIGKNIVKVLLENYGFQVIDLGRDVPAEKVVEAAIREDIRLVGLSALMTTTVPGMEKTIRALRKKKPGTLIMVGGAVLTAEYACQIGADFYGKDAMASVNFARKVFA